MSDPEVATKAPESDAADDTPSTSENPDAKPPLCDDCTSDRPTPSGQAATGEIVKINGIDCYISKPADYPHVPARLLLLLTGGTGVKSTNNQIQADKYAGEGFLSVMPDLFEGDAAPNSKVTEDENIPLIEKIKMRVADAAKSFVLDMWLARHTDEKVLPILHKVLGGSKEMFTDAANNGIYGVGYCFGGRYILLLSSERELPTSWEQKSEDEEGGSKLKGPFLKAGALAHATCVTPEDFNGLKAPISMVCVENDGLFPDDVRVAGEDYLSKNNVEHEVQVYPGVPHGFAIVGEYENANIKEAQVTAYEQMLSWVKDH
ncbi:uncharacterized protein MKZ38_009473 [Zalerion maritima]|uniref:Dienelactone hydrolase domain-containing protein n=1 Tax=Zalerion maritima TaxID=339359 RepID=A0AAD5WN60_9PEZI|nr:uncharacterized protein MKZ38_009473 [Zalerion maritima]